LPKLQQAKKGMATIRGSNRSPSSKLAVNTATFTIRYISTKLCYEQAAHKELSKPIVAAQQHKKLRPLA
jgi:hypothetical protein